MMPAIVLYLKYLNIPILNLVYFLFFSSLKRSNDSTRIIITAIMGIAFGFFVGISISSVHLTKVIFTTVILFNVLSHVFHPYNFSLVIFCRLAYFLHLQPVGNSFDVPVAESEIDRFSAEVNRSPAVIDESSGTKNLETLGSIRLPKVISMLILQMDVNVCVFSEK